MKIPVQFVPQLKNIKLLPNDVVIIDRRLLSFRQVKSWTANSIKYPVVAGESLKDIKKFPSHMEKILRLTNKISPKELRFVVIGGGSVGDFGGFIASVYKRGMPLINIPSTWLAAVDSSHGGKTGLNAAGTKNQVGSFYPAKSVYVCKELLFLQPRERALDAYGEVVKAFLLDAKLSRTNFLSLAVSEETLWKFLKQCIEAKYRIVNRDPKEQSGIRSLLNLGHTVGHAFEVVLKWPHGKAILYGLAFDLFWSEEQGLITSNDLKNIVNSKVWKELFHFQEYQKALSFPSKRIMKLIQQDKKKTTSKNIRQVFVARAGKPLLETIPLQEIRTEYERQQKYFH
ncbi:MAG: hypothetical protein V4736_00720 [Bdellovibrionota bacterium]